MNSLSPWEDIVKAASTLMLNLKWEPFLDKKSKNILHTSAPQSKNTVSTFQITCRALSFVLENS